MTPGGVVAEPALTPTGWVALTLIVAAVIGWKLLAARIWPWTRCSGCEGGKRPDGNGNWRNHRRCKGSGKKLRLTYRLVWRRGRDHLPLP